MPGGLPDSVREKLKGTPLRARAGFPAPCTGPHTTRQRHREGRLEWLSSVVDALYISSGLRKQRQPALRRNQYRGPSITSNPSSSRTGQACSSLGPQAIQAGAERAEGGIQAGERRSNSSTASGRTGERFRPVADADPAAAECRLHAMVWLNRPPGPAPALPPQARSKCHRR